MRRLVRLVLLSFALALALPAGALAAEQTLVFTSSPIKLGSYAVARGEQAVPSPRLDGYVVGMNADVVDANGKVLPDAVVMLHHVVFVKVLAQDYTCSVFRDYEGRSSPFPVERFYAEGEEHMQLALPPGYGYQNRAQDIWGLVYMLMNHRKAASTVRVRYTVRYATDETLTAARPIWLDVRNCTADPIFSVPGTGGRGSTYTQHADFRMPESGRLIAGGGHLHGGGVALHLSVLGARCGANPAFSSFPTWGGIEPQPVMHEPGPTMMTGFSSASGIGVQAGETLRLEAVYDNSFPHVRVMGIMLVYFAPGSGACERALPKADVIPALPPSTRLPLLKKPTGPLYKNIKGTWVGDYLFGAQRVSIRRGTTFTWRFIGRVQHDVTLANGPVGFASPSLKSGTYRFRFTRRGTYRLFCSLHPTRMTQVVTVR